MSEDNFVLYKHFKKYLTKDEFYDAKREYLNSLNEKKYIIKNTNNIYELIQNIKRNPEDIGPYRNISVFESLNRIATDLVLLAGADKLFNNSISTIKPLEIKLNLGTTHGFDFIVKTIEKQKIYGEAFNAAESFCKYKLRQAIHKFVERRKLRPTKSAIVFINEEVRSVLSKYKNEKEEKLKKKNVLIHKVYCETNNLMI